MAKQTQEQQDLETCRMFMASIENTARGLADYGANFIGRSWITDSKSQEDVSAIFRDAVKKLREGFVGLSEAEDILAQAVPQKPHGKVRKLLTGGA